MCQRVLDVVEVLGVLDFPALLALKGRQNTDGGKQRAAPDLRQVNNTPSLRRWRKGGGRGRVWRLTGGYASLTPVCTLPPFQGSKTSFTYRSLVYLGRQPVTYR